MISLRSLEVFYWVATLQNFSQAAARLHMTQPAVSQRISSLEEQFGGLLFERSHRTVQITPQGRQLLVYADRMLLMHTEMMLRISATNRLGGVVRLGVSETIIQTWLSKYIKKVNASYPAVTFEIEVDVSQKLKASLLKHELDLAFLMGPVAEPDFVDIPLDSFQLAFVCESLLASQIGSPSTDEITKHVIITYHKNTSVYREIQKLLRSSESANPRIHTSSSLSMIIRMTLDGLGIAVIPPSLIQNYLVRDELRIVPTEIDLTPLHFTASYRLGSASSISASLAQLAVTTSSSYADGYKEF